MKALLMTVCFFAGIQAQAKYVIQKFPGKVNIQVDIAVGDQNPLDILFVIDNSGSMITHQQNLAGAIQNIEARLSHLKRDYQAGIISTDMLGSYPKGPAQAGRLLGSPKIITPQTPAGTLSKNAILGTDGSYEEQPLAATLAALSEPLASTDNAGFLRPNANLALVFLTDAEDQSRLTSNDFVNGLEKIKGDLTKVTAFSWLVPSNDPFNCQRDERSLPVTLEEVTARLNGKIFNLCGMDQKSVEEFSQGVASFGYKGGEAALREIPLTIAPAAETIKVQYGSQVLVGGDMQKGWIYDASKNQVILGADIQWSQQPRGTMLEVSFVPADWQK